MKKVITMGIVVGLLFSVIPLTGLFVSAETEGDFEYSIADNKTTIEYYSGKGGNVTIPSILGGCPVTIIGQYAFDNSYITSVTIPDTVIVIENSAFKDCNSLESIVIPNSVTSVGNQAFSSESLKSISIPDSVQYIGQDAFFNTEWYNSQPDGLIYAGKVAYVWKGEMPENTLVEIKAGTVSISDNAFYSCYSLASVTLPDSLITIGSCAFEGCYSLASVTLPGSLLTIGSRAFYHCESIKSLTIPNSVTNIGNYTFFYCESLESITLGNQLTNIEENTFNLCSALKQITIPESVSSIGENAFIGCSSLESVTISEGVVNISDYAFEDCTSLVSLTTPHSLKSIGNGAFLNCTSMKSIKILNSDTIIGSTALGYYNYGSNKTPEFTINSFKDSKVEQYTKEEGYIFVEIKDVTVENGILTQYNGDGKSVFIPEDVISVADGVFDGYNSLIVYGNSGSFANTFAIEHNFQFIALDAMILGDLDNNKNINAADALLVLQAAVKKITLNPEQTKAADVNKDCKVTATDALLILQFAVNKITEF